jgi:hypothetical protein
MAFTLDLSYVAEESAFGNAYNLLMCNQKAWAMRYFAGTVVPRSSQMALTLMESTVPKTHRG